MGFIGQGGLSIEFAQLRIRQNPPADIREKGSVVTTLNNAWKLQNISGAGYDFFSRYGAFVNIDLLITAAAVSCGMHVFMHSFP